MENNTEINNKWLLVNDEDNDENDTNDNILYNIIIYEALRTFINKPRPSTPVNLEI